MLGPSLCMQKKISVPPPLGNVSRVEQAEMIKNFLIRIHGALVSKFKSPAPESDHTVFVNA